MSQSPSLSSLLHSKGESLGWRYLPCLQRKDMQLLAPTRLSTHTSHLHRAHHAHHAHHLPNQPRHHDTQQPKLTYLESKWPGVDPSFHIRFWMLRSRYRIQYCLTSFVILHPWSMQLINSIVVAHFIFIFSFPFSLYATSSSSSRSSLP